MQKQTFYFFSIKRFQTNELTPMNKKIITSTLVVVI